MHTIDREVTWDPIKAHVNLRKHGVAFAEAAEALDDPNALTMSETSFPEARVVTLCSDPPGHLLVVAYAPRNDSLRLISARRATARERRAYEEVR